MDDASAKPGDSSRRSFLKGMSAFPLLSLFADKSPAADDTSTVNTFQNTNPASADKKKFVAIQVGARSFVDEGVEKVLDDLQQKGGVNVLMPAVFTYGRGLSGRQIPGQPLPDHGGQE